MEEITKITVIPNPHSGDILAGIINGNRITNDRDELMWACESKKKVGWLTRWHLEFMAACDLGIRWDNLAKGPTLIAFKNIPKPIDS